MSNDMPRCVCGGEARTFQAGDKHMVGCESCEASGPWFDTPDLAADWWRRAMAPPEPEPKPLPEYGSPDWTCCTCGDNPCMCDQQ